jgi:hypothetical protein
MVIEENLAIAPVVIIPNHSPATTNCSEPTTALRNVSLLPSFATERLVKAGPGDAGVLRELHHAARSSDNAERVNQHLPIHRLFEFRLEVIFDVRFGHT